jgi:hypothetical protein
MAVEGAGLPRHQAGGSLHIHGADYQRRPEVAERSGARKQWPRWRSGCEPYRAVAARRTTPITSAPSLP